MSDIKTPPMVPIAKATVGDLRQLAQLVFGLELEDKATKSDILTALKSVGWSGDKVPQISSMSAPTVELPADGEIPAWEGTFNDNPKLRMLTCVNVQRREVPGGSQPVPVSVNGVRLDIPRGRDCVVPIEYVEVLIHAVERHWISDLENGLINYRDVPQFPFMFKPRPRDEEAA